MMNAQELELVPTAVLIEELMSRKTFLGLVIYSQKEARTGGTTHEEFRAVFSPPLRDADAKCLLAMAQEQVNTPLGHGPPGSGT